MRPATLAHQTEDRPQAPDKLQTEFVSVVSHELRTPVSAIQGYTDLLLENAYGELNPEQREIVAYVKEAAGGLMGMIDNLLNLTVMNRGQTDLVLRTFLVEEVIRDVLLTCRADYERKKLSVSYEVEPGDLCIRSDKIKLQQILTNLIVNAIRYTDAGWIRIRAHQLESESGVFEIAVSDSGPGISEIEQQRIFEQFYRVKSARQRESQGMGLGLYIVNSLVKMLGGSVAVQSAPGQGATFSIRLPVVIEETRALQNLVHFNQEALGNNGGTAKVIPLNGRVVLFLGGGDAKKRELLSNNLKQDGIQVVAAEDMEQLMAKVGALQPQAIMLDPDFAARSDGDVFQQLKVHSLTKGIPVLFFMESAASGAGKALGRTASPEAVSSLPTRTAPVGNNGATKYRVLVTDDDPGMREALQVALESEGYEVLLASDGQEGLRLLAEQHPDLMLLDLMMPGLNGWQVIEILAQKPELRSTKVLMLTGAALTPEEVQKLTASTGGLLRKDEMKLNSVLAGVAKALGQQ